MKAKSFFLAFFLFFLLVPLLAWAYSMTWTTNDDWNRGTHTNTTTDNNDLILSGVVKNSTGSYLSNTTPAANIIQSMKATWNATGMNWTQTSQADFGNGTLTNVSTTEVAGSVVLAKSVVVIDDFEDAVFSGWSLYPGFAGGTMVRSNNVTAKSGSYEATLIPTESNGQYVMTKSISSSTDLTVWFYDPFGTGGGAADRDCIASVNSLVGMMGWNGNVAGGQDNYIYLITAWTASNVPRTVGWHSARFLIVGSDLVLSIDGNYVATKTGYSTPFTSVQLWARQDNLLYRYFDYINYAKDYITSGSFASQVLDTKYPGTLIRKAFVNSTVYTGSTLANISLSVGYSNDNIAWSYTSAQTFTSNGTQVFDFSDVSGRYIKWNATLRTNNTNTTPILHDVNIEYIPISVELTADGATWLTVANNTEYTTGFGTGTSFRYRVSMSTNNISQTPRLHDITIEYALIVIVGYAPQLISLQGKLSSATTHSPLTGSYSMNFKIYDVSTGGTPLWTETQTVSASQGIFNAILGSVTTLDLTFDKQYWLEISVAGETLTPRQQITSVPYAYRAKY